MLEHHLTLEADVFAVIDLIRRINSTCITATIYVFSDL